MQHKHCMQAPRRTHKHINKYNRHTPLVTFSPLHTHIIKTKAGDCASTERSLTMTPVWSGPLTPASLRPPIVHLNPIRGQTDSHRPDADF